MSADVVARLDAAHNRLRARVVDEQIELDERERVISVRASDLAELVAAAYGTAAAGDLAAGELLMLGRVKTALDQETI